MGLSVVCFIAGMTAAAAGDDCSNAANQSAMTICADDAYKSADRDLNAQYAQTRKAVLAYDPEGDKLLITAQRAWVIFRDAHCAASSFAFKGGSAEPFSRDMCLTSTTKARTEELKKMLSNYLH